MTASPRRAGPDQATLRGVVVLVVAVVIGIVLLTKAGDVGDSAEAGSAKPEEKGRTTSTTTPQSTLAPVTQDTVTQSTRPAGEVKVIVANASLQSGVASTNTEKLSSAGFQTLEATNAPAAPTTTVYFAEGYEADAAAVAEAVGLPDAPTEPAPAQPVVPDAAEANVVVLLGQDYQPG